MGNHQESSKAKRFLFGLLFTLHFIANFSASALQTGDDGLLVVSVKGRVGESKHNVRVYEERRIASTIPSRGIRKTLRLQSVIHADPGVISEGIANAARGSSVNTKAIVIAAPIAGVVAVTGILILCIWCCRRHK